MEDADDTEDLGGDLGGQITAEELASTLKVLSLLGSDDALLQSPAMRLVRKALSPLFEAQCQKMFGGQPSKDQYTHRKEQKKMRKFIKNQQKQEDAKFVAKTLLRAGRIKRLEALAEQGLGDIQLVLDGVGLDDGAGGGLLLRDAADEDEDEDDGDEGGEVDDTEDKTEQEEGDEEEDLDEDGGEGAAREKTGSRPRAPPRLQQSRQCYTCKRRYTALHHFYDKVRPRPRCASYSP